jgi:hypothetical protein
MDILKAFSLLDTEYQINIQGTLEDPLFQANQIGKLLGIISIKDNIKDFTEDEKGADTTLNPWREPKSYTKLNLLVNSDSNEVYMGFIWKLLV